MPSHPLSLSLAWRGARVRASYERYRPAEIFSCSYTVCTYIHSYIYIHVHTHTYTSLGMHTYICIRTWVHQSIYICAHAYILHLNNLVKKDKLSLWVFRHMVGRHVLLFVYLSPCPCASLPRAVVFSAKFAGICLFLVWSYGLFDLRFSRCCLFLSQFLFASILVSPLSPGPHFPLFTMLKI